MRALSIALCATLLLARGAAAAEKWIELKSSHFTVWSQGSKGDAANLLSQLEQIRAAVKAQWPWAKVDLGKRMVMIAARDERDMRVLAPQYWETKGAVHPTSVWVTGADQHYIAIRTDQKQADTATVNPYTSVYFSYVHLVLDASFASDLPLWFSRGLAGVLSNTIVRDDSIAIGAPIPWHLRELQEHGRLPLDVLVTVDRNSPEYRQGDRLTRFDAESWAFVHFLMFGNEGANASRLNRFAALLQDGVDAKRAFAEALGNADAYTEDFTGYLSRTIFSYGKMKVDAGVKKDAFVMRPLPVAEAAAGLAVFHVGMRRPAEARADIEKARKLDQNSADTFLAEALQLDAAAARDDARAAFRKAADLGSPNPYAHFRAATICWPASDEATLKRMESDLSRAIELHPFFAAAYANLAEVRALLNQPADAVLPQLEKAIAFEPSNAWHRLTAARVFYRMRSLDAARQAAETALRLADNIEARRQAEQILGAIKR